MGRIQQQVAYRKYRQFTDEQWKQVLLDSVSGTAPVPMPGFPDAGLQANFVGSAGTNAIQEAWNFYELMAERRAAYGRPLDARSRVLDFGCGWGRYARMFLRDVPANNIWCVDSWDLALRTCEETGVPGRRVKIGQMPPTSLPARSFDTAFAYSVFSHLSPTAHLAWQEEFARVMTAGALVFITTQARWFLDNCRDYREHPDKQVSDWHVGLAGSFVDYERDAAAYDRGEILYAPTGGGPELLPEYYGEAIVPRGYFEEHWGGTFEILEFIADRSRFEQAVCIMRRR